MMRHVIFDCLHYNDVFLTQRGRANRTLTSNFSYFVMLGEAVSPYSLVTLSVTPVLFAHDLRSDTSLHAYPVRIYFPAIFNPNSDLAINSSRYS